MILIFDYFYKILIFYHILTRYIGQVIIYLYQRIKIMIIKELRH